MRIDFRYTTHPAFAYQDSLSRTLDEKTGATMEQWLQRMTAAGLEGKKEQSAWLKSQGLGLNYSGVILDAASGKGGREQYRPEQLVAQLFSGPKAALLPVYEAVLEFSQSLGDEVRVCPCETMIPFYRHHVFAQVKAPNRTRLHLGLALGNRKAERGLVDTGGLAKKDRITHRLELAAETDFNGNAKKWFLAAFDRDSLQKR